MAIMSSNTFPQDLRPGVHMWYGTSHENYPAVYDRILDVQEAGKAGTLAYEEDVMISGLGLPQVRPEGSPSDYDVGKQLYSTRYVHVEYSKGFAITRIMMQDGIALKNGELFAKDLKQNMLKARDIVATNVYVGGFSPPTSTQGGDGVAWFSASHVTPAGNQSNVPTLAATLSESSLEQMHLDVGQYKNKRGTLIYARAQKLIIPQTLQFTAARILKNTDRPGTADRDINAQVVLGMQPEVVVNPYLDSSSTSHWYVGTDQRGRCFYNREDMTLSNDSEFDTDNMKFKGTMRFSCGQSDFLCGYGVNI